VTLTVTVPGRRAIYQSADYRLLDLSTGQTSDFKTQKGVLINAFGWTAVVAFAGIGRTTRVDVSEWLASHVASIGGNDPFERVIEALLDADSWLSPVEQANRRHSFSVGAFDESTPIFALVSNYESTVAPQARLAADRLTVSRIRPTRATTFVSGQAWAVSRSQRRGIARMVERDPEPAKVYEALASLNRAVSDETPLVSPSCFTSHIRLTGEGGGQIHGGDEIPFMPTFAFPPEVRKSVLGLLDEQFGPGRARLVGMSSGRAGATDAFHQVQLREKPLDPNVHTNYGAYLKETKADTVGAEREYRKALELQPDHINALGNLANLLWDRDDLDEARNLYERALQPEPPDENASWNFARFLIAAGEPANALAVVERALRAHTESGRLYLLKAQLLLSDSRGREALAELDQAQQAGADLASVESGRAIALHVTGAPIAQTIGAYWTAIGFNSNDGVLHLNLAQLLFLLGDADQAEGQLAEAVKLGLDGAARLEAAFYQAAHTEAYPSVVLQRIRTLLDAGARLAWDVSPNIELVGRTDSKRATFLRQLEAAMKGELPMDSVHPPNS